MRRLGPRSMWGAAALALIAIACTREVEVVKEVPVEVVQPAGSLVVYSGRSESLVGPIIEQFRDATGIDVSVKYGSTPEVASTIIEEGSNSPADVFFAQDPGGLGAVAQTGMLAGLPDDILGLVPDWARSSDGMWVGVSGRARTVVYNTERLSEADLPGSILGFTDPAWKGRIGWAPTNASFQTMVTAMRVMWGDDKTGEWLRGIQANEPKLYPKNTPIVAAAASGEIDVGFVNHYYLHRFIQEDGEGFGARNYYLKDEGPGSLIMVAGAGIMTTARNRENAERFLHFMLSGVAQQYFAGKTYEYPLVGDVNTHRLLVPLLDIANPGIDMTSLSDLRGTQTMLRDLGVIP